MCRNITCILIIFWSDTQHTQTNKMSQSAQGPAAAAAAAKGPFKYIGVPYYRIVKGRCEDYGAAYQPQLAHDAIKAYNGFSKGDCISKGFTVMVHPTEYKKL